MAGEICRSTRLKAIFFAVSFLNDLHEFDLSTMMWTDISGQVQGISPSRRYDHGFSFALGKLFIFGGLDEGGENISLCTRASVRLSKSVC